jgi:hypothetical protein
MVGSRVRTPRARSPVTLLAMAAIATALSGVAPAAAGGNWNDRIEQVSVC